MDAMGRGQEGGWSQPHQGGSEDNGAFGDIFGAQTNVGREGEGGGGKRSSCGGGDGENDVGGRTFSGDGGDGKSKLHGGGGCWILERGNEGGAACCSENKENPQPKNDKTGTQLCM